MSPALAPAVCPRNFRSPHAAAGRSSAPCLLESPICAQSRVRGRGRGTWLVSASRLEVTTHEPSHVAGVTRTVPGRLRQRASLTAGAGAGSGGHSSRLGRAQRPELRLHPPRGRRRPEPRAASGQPLSPQAGEAGQRRAIGGLGLGQGRGRRRRVRRPSSPVSRRAAVSSQVISPDFPLESTGFFSGKHLIHFLVLRIFGISF